MTEEDEKEAENQKPLFSPKNRSTVLLLAGLCMMILAHDDVVTHGAMPLKKLVFGVIAVVFGLGGFIWPHIFDTVGPDGKERIPKTAIALAALCTFIFRLS